MTMLRSTLFNIYFFALTAVLALYGGVLLLVGARSRVLPLTRFWARVMCAGLRVICGIELVVTGLEHVPATGPALLASQHQSAFDTFVWLMLVPRPAYVLKRELLRIPVFGALIRPAGQIAIDRAAGAAALRGLLREADAAVSAGRQIVIFPEGTRVDPGQQVKLQPGIAALASRTGLPVIPVVTDSGYRWSRRAFRKHPGPIHIRVLPPLPAGLPRDALMSRLLLAWREGSEQLHHVDKSVGTA